MIWATVEEVRAYVDAQAATLGRAEWPALPEADSAVQTLIDSAARSLSCKVIRWPVLDEADEHAEDPVQRQHMVVAVCETIRARQHSAVQESALGGMSPILAAGGSITADNLSVSGGRGARVGRSASQVPWPAYEALQAGGLIGGSVATW
ncbi:MAG TPA: hypothetical protein VFV67_34145 [Actinophytocola sp.]|uniref:hypothetical protein n=1 Tax=Actinophytocola sp. TaxID=1872138 RepID=UPI002DBDE74B|nr:hypothetical protein [Actinophytocola sp.]HEU5475710.1 hypothetical protein [Actinophytocola sp.]